MISSFLIKKILNNNVVIAERSGNQEVILIGKGIGFGRNQGELISEQDVDKLFLLVDGSEQERYKQLLSDVDESLILLIEEMVQFIQAQLQIKLDERIHLALTDHIQFAIRRIEQGIEIPNPFLMETEIMFPQEFAVARKVVEQLNIGLDVELPEAEIGFITLHINRAYSKKTIAETSVHPQLIHELVELIEKELNIHIDKQSVQYMRIVSYLCDVVDRFKVDGDIYRSNNLTHVLKEEFQLCYNVTNLIVDLLNNRFSSSYSIGQMPDVVLFLKKLLSIHK
ncbi:PRD domain-containing protein [Halalkalibacter urbisdiaboli]|uniref:PRD domain-containing protein n=1 Tax=Halalkalibacter urbisdiaboli TaxID=1960589 RepID=UPI000B444125|nr:PRD domain-containing protein [Halalkalibacter urbisdiaboli]